MKVLYVATKCPWPPIDGGRLLVDWTLRGLAAAGAETTLVAPVDPDDPASAEAERRLRDHCVPVLVPSRRGRAASLFATARGLPLTVARHARPELRATVARLIGEGRFAIVHAEQAQALFSCADARAAGRPLVVRCQNVESDLWRQAAAHAGWRRPAMALEAWRLARWEARALASTSAVVALTAEDADAVRALAPGARVVEVPAPFPSTLPPSSSVLPGVPAVIVFGSRGWWPNEEGARWFVRQVWPRVRAALPTAVLHVFGLEAQGPGVTLHPAPADSQAAFASNAVMVVPLRVASGVRVKVLEAWARGLPVVASPAAAAGLQAEHGRALMVAPTADEFATAIARLADDAGSRARLVEGGREVLTRRHDPAQVASQLLDVYRSVGAAP